MFRFSRTAMRQLCVILVFVALTAGRVDQTPRPHLPGDPVVYPKDYCGTISDNEEFDFIVVGSGPAGSAVARRLAEVPNFRVLLVEAGGDPPDISDIPGNTVKLGLELRWQFKTTVSPNQCRGVQGDACVVVPGRVLGGCSVVNYMMYCRGNRRDYDDWAYLGNSGWSYEDVLPYFRKLENFLAEPSFSIENLFTNRQYHNMGGPLTTTAFNIDPRTHHFRKAFLQAARVSGIPFNRDVNGGSQMGITNLPGMVNSLGYRYNVAKAYLMNIPDNLKVCKYATVTRVLFQKKRAVGVEFLYKPENGTVATARTIQVRAKKETILSAGPINSPAILERSGIGRADVLQAAGVKPVHILPAVGENLQDHYINLGSAFQVDFGTAAISNPLTIELTSLTAFVNLTNRHSDTPDVQFILKTHSSLIPLGLQYKMQIAAQLNAVKPNLLFVGGIVLQPQVPGSTHITQSADPFQSPRIQPNQLVGQRDLELTVAATRLARKIMADPALARFNPKPFTLEECGEFAFDSDDEIICGAKYLSNSLHHMVGTTAMGPDPATSVVDPFLKVHDVDGLRVIDSGVMPLVPRGNTQIPTVMIGEKGANLIKSEYTTYFSSLGYGLPKNYTPF